MGSFQQITMGIGCLIAAFWFGSILQDRPAGQNQTAELLPAGTIDPYRTTASPSIVEKTKGFLDSIFESPNKEKPITVADLRADSKRAIPSLLNPEGQQGTSEPHQIDRFSPAYDPSKNLVFQNGPTTNGGSQAKDTRAPKRFVGNFDSPDQPKRLAKVAIVPDFSSLAEEVNRGLSFNDAPNVVNDTPLEVQPLNSTASVELIPVPKFSDVVSREPDSSSAPNWEAVREQVAAAERRLESYRDQMTQPIPEIAEIAETVNRRTQEFWDRQQTEARRRPAQQSRLVNHLPLETSQQHRLKPETREQRQARWDVFGNNRNDRRHQEQTPPRPKPRIVEVDRPLFERPVIERSVIQRPVVDRQPPRTRANTKSSAVVRSLNDDRDAPSIYGNSQYEDHERDRFAHNTPQRQQPTKIQNQLRPQYNPNAGSQPEFVSPPDYGQFSSQTSSAPDQESEIVEAAKVTYGSFREYETQPQDTLQTISEEFYGTADYYFDLYLANRDLLSNPATVPSGITIKIPRFDSR